MLSLRRSRAALLSLFLALLLLAPQAPAALAPLAWSDDDFCSIVLQHFDAWDADCNGEITSLELDALAVNIEIKGAPAAAVGVLKAYDRSKKTDLPPLTREYFTSRKSELAAGKKPEPALESRYSRTLRRIKAVRHALFDEKGPTLASCRQGSLGDCYLISMVGALTHHHPEMVRDMFTAHEDGSYSVAFATGEPVQVAGLTDASMALTSSAGNGAIWLPVIEKAYGTVRSRSLPKDRQRAETTDAIANGGSTAPVIRLLTGHATERMSFKAMREDSKRMDSDLPKLREKLKTAVAAKRLIGVGSPSEGNPPGINPRHAYAVLEFDEASDTVGLWNPHNNRVRPRGEPGLKNGYPTQGGRFKMPLADFIKVFGGVTIETDRPATPAAAPTPAKAASKRN